MGLKKRGIIALMLSTALLASCQVVESPTPTISSAQISYTETLPPPAITPSVDVPLKTIPTNQPTEILDPTPGEATKEPGMIPESGLASVFGVGGLTSNINPLTGLQVNEQWRIERRPISVKISNSLDVRPQSGLSFADIVFEYYIGEGINRFLALFYGQDVPQAGPIRSGRMVDAQLVNMYQGILAYGSADPRVDKLIISELGDRAISHLEAACPVICGQETHISPGVYGNTFELTQYARKHGVTESRQYLTGMIFDPTPPQTSQFGVKIGVQYASFDKGEWRYNQNTTLYDHWIDNRGDTLNLVPLTDRLTGKQVSFSNILVLFVEYVEFNPTLHNIKVWNNTTGQRALFFRDGLMVEGSWRAPGHYQPFQFYNQMGLPMALKPGNTWIVLAGNHSTFDTTGPGTWDLHFHLP